MGILQTSGTISLNDIRNQFGADGSLLAVSNFIASCRALVTSCCPFPGRWDAAGKSKTMWAKSTLAFSKRFLDG